MSTVTKKEMGKRYSLLILGIIFISFGIAIITKADLGTSPISAVPYSLSLIWTFFTLGNWTILFNLFLIVMEILLLSQITSLRSWPEPERTCPQNRQAGSRNGQYRKRNCRKRCTAPPHRKWPTAARPDPEEYG